jgi:hypothetical protein
MHKLGPRKRLHLNRETLARLSPAHLAKAMGGDPPTTIRLTGSGDINQTCQISICFGCTKALDGCG